MAPSATAPPSSAFFRLSRLFCPFKLSRNNLINGVVWPLLWFAVLAVVATQISRSFLDDSQPPLRISSSSSVHFIQIPDIEVLTLRDGQQEPNQQADEPSDSRAEEDNTASLRLPSLFASPMHDQKLSSHGSLWTNPPAKGYQPCVQRSEEYNRSGTAVEDLSRGYLTAHANGGLNQMRAGICDMVAIARILNATLIIPDLDKSSFWHDNSTFFDIFDAPHFISSLQPDVAVLPSLPAEMRGAEVKRLHFQSWGSLDYYQREVASWWRQYKVIRALKTDSRLANNNLPPGIQKLRCRVHFDALRFAPKIEAFGKELVRRMRSDGPFIALHLRFEKDMLAFSGCTEGLSQKETEELTQIRLQTKHWREKLIDSAAQRSLGLCPMTPEEVGRFLSALGFPNSTRVYIAAGEIFGGERAMDGLRSFFPFLQRKETLASEKELLPFRPHLNAMAALDYIVSIQSDVFVATYSGNMARAVEGHRRFLGHRKTITPDRKLLAALFDRLKRGEIEWQRLTEEVALGHMHRMGAPRVRKVPAKKRKNKDTLRQEEPFYSNPVPDCICREKAKEQRGKVVAFRRKKLSVDRAGNGTEFVGMV